MLIAQISDSHLLRRGTRLYGAVDAHRALERAVEALLRLDPAPDAVVHTGDLVNDGEAEDYAQAMAILRRLPMPLHVVPGNHDRRALMRAALDPGAAADDGPLNVCADCGDVRLVGLDTLVEGEAGGRVGADQLAWLDRVLSQAPERPALVFLHHPPFATGLRFMDRVGLSDAAALDDVIARHRQVGLVAAGHVHRAIQTVFAGTFAVTAPGTAHQVVLDLRPGAGGRWVPEPPAFLLHRFDAETGFVSHMAYIGEHGADAPFHGDHAVVEP